MLLFSTIKPYLVDDYKVVFGPQEESGLEAEASDTVEDVEDAETAEDYFDRIVGEIEDVIIDERFLQLQSGKAEAMCLKLYFTRIRFGLFFAI
jgi:hypothetical protein